MTRIPSRYPRRPKSEHCTSRLSIVIALQTYIQTDRHTVHTPEKLPRRIASDNMLRRLQASDTVRLTSVVALEYLGRGHWGHVAYEGPAVIHWLYKFNKISG